jgi:sulfonate transport system substrate-binding protein
VKVYEKKYPSGSAVPTGVRDDASTLYCLTGSVKDAAKAAALKAYDLLAKEQGHKKLDVSTLVDRRFEKVEAAAAGSDVVTGSAS